MYVMSGIARYGLKHGVPDASAKGGRVSLTLRSVVKDPKDKKWATCSPCKWRKDPSSDRKVKSKVKVATGYKCADETCVRCFT